MTIIRDRIRHLAGRGMSLEEVLAARPTLDFDGVFDDPVSPAEAFIEGLYREVSEALDPSRVVGSDHELP
jgi:cyclase